MVWFLLLAVVLVVGFFANVVGLGWGLAIVVCIGIVAAIVIPIFKKWDNDAKKENEVLQEKKNKLNDKNWVKSHPDLAKSYDLDVRKIPRASAVKCNLIPGHIHRYGYNESFNRSYPDSAGGWDLEITIKNQTDKVINYVDIKVTPIDRVGNVAYSSIGNQSTTSIRCTGPLQAYGKITQYSKNIWYNIVLGSVRTELITVTFNDNTKQEIYSNGKFINYDKTGKKIDV